MPVCVLLCVGVLVCVLSSVGGTRDSSWLIIRSISNFEEFNDFICLVFRKAPEEVSRQDAATDSKNQKNEMKKIKWMNRRQKKIQNKKKTFLIKKKGENHSKMTIEHSSLTQESSAGHVTV